MYVGLVATQGPQLVGLIAADQLIVLTYQSNSRNLIPSVPNL